MPRVEVCLGKTGFNSLSSSSGSFMAWQLATVQLHGVPSSPGMRFDVLIPNSKPRGAWINKIDQITSRRLCSAEYQLWLHWLQYTRRVYCVNCYVCCTATIVRPLPAICILCHQNSKSFLCRNSEEAETIGNVRDWCHVTSRVSFVASLRLEP